MSTKPKEITQIPVARAPGAFKVEFKFARNRGGELLLPSDITPIEILGLVGEIVGPVAQTLAQAAVAENALKAGLVDG